ncbi:MAG: alkaline phosphatase family protein [Gemmatimonadaceae bacterium]|nr:alkaline phosphatase family protein [Gemmatimonadaceae bacterium]
MTHDTTTPRLSPRLTPHLLLIVADGVRPDVLAEEITAGHTPALAELAARGGQHTVTSSFPSVTGPAYVPFLMGRHPASVGLPGLRWYDRARTLSWAFTPTRSYAGIDIWHVDRDLAPDAPTLLELAQPSLSGMCMLSRGATHGRIGRSTAWMIRGAPVHFRGDLRGWQRVEQMATSAFFDRFSAVQPRASVLAITSADKYAHKFGPHSDEVRSSIADIDRAVSMAHAIADRDHWQNPLHVWVVGDHGHEAITQHEDLHGWFVARGFRVLAHPQLTVRNPDVALMVGGNAMAHLYLEPASRTRHWWPHYATRWESMVDALVARESIDLAAVALDSTTVRVTQAGRGTAHITMTGEDHEARFSYRPITGDPLGLGGSHTALDRSDAWMVTRQSPYPDALMQLLLLVTAPRSGDIVLSASTGWDLRARYEPVSHVSTHGALLREQMQVPLLLDIPTQREPQRTADVVPSALDLLGIESAALWDGQSFLR